MLLASLILLYVLIVACVMSLCGIFLGNVPGVAVSGSNLGFICLACIAPCLLACTLDCGIFVEDARVLDLACHLHHEEHLAHDISAYFNYTECRSAVSASRDVQQGQMLWTDGAASNNQALVFSMQEATK